MINIYCLIDPRNNKPFYVGATIQPIETRLSGHISEIGTYSQKYRSDKMVCIAQLMNIGKRPKVRLLLSTSIYAVDFYEYFFYLMFIHQGYDLYQDNNRFYYYNQKNKSRLRKAKRQQLKKYMQLSYKNILIIIW